MYKILALNCLITAFSLSALYLDGIKYGDTQVTIQGFLLAGCFLFLSWGKPINRLSRKRPQPNIFNFYILSSVLGQFAVHCYSLWHVVIEAKKLLPEDWKPDLESTKFEPNVLNSAVYLISLSMQVSTFLINYQVCHVMSLIYLTAIGPAIPRITAGEQAVVFFFDGFVWASGCGCCSTKCRSECHSGTGGIPRPIQRNARQVYFA